jgi:hypothetical protein
MHRRPARSPRTSVLSLLALICLAPACSEQTAPGDTSGSVLGGDRIALAPGMGGGPPASLRNIWPNEDGRAWTYRLDQKTWAGGGEFRIYPTLEEVPPSLTLDQVVSLLGNHPLGDNPVLEQAGYRMRFAGLKTTLSGAVGQNLETEILDLTSAATGTRRGAVASAGFWRALARARPDLADRIAALRPDLARTAAGTAAEEVSEPLFLFGYAWEKTREHIGSYGDLNTILSWKYLEADLDPGHEFSIQLVPDLTDDVFLHVRVLRERTATTPLGDHPRSIDVLYLVDYGISEATDVDGNTIGYHRSNGYGVITYAPKVGPVRTYEREFFSVGEPLDPGFRELTAELTAVVPGRNGPLP